MALYIKLNLITHKIKSGMELLKEPRLIKMENYIQKIKITGVLLINYQSQVLEKFGVQFQILITQQIITTGLRVMLLQ
jgi:hypothetical protein